MDENQSTETVLYQSPECSNFRAQGALIPHSDENLCKILDTDEKFRKILGQWIDVHVDRRGIKDKKERAGLIRSCLDHAYKEWLRMLDDEIVTVAKSKLGFNYSNLLMTDEKMKKYTNKFIYTHLREMNDTKKDRADIIKYCIQDAYKEWLRNMDIIEYYLS